MLEAIAKRVDNEATIQSGIAIQGSDTSSTVVVEMLDSICAISWSDGKVGNLYPAGDRHATSGRPQYAQRNVALQEK